jgi:3-oxoacyl-[acyl-carrier protein] reductase
VNNAGIGFDGLLTFMREGDIDRLLDVNLRGAILLTQACVKDMIKRGAGSVVNISSVNGVRGHNGVSVYSATKAALDALIKTYAAECAATKVRVNLFNPGPTRTIMRAKAFPGEDPMTLPAPEDIAPAIVALALPDETRNGEVVPFERRER